MPILSITRLRVRKWYFVPKFLWLSSLIMKQAHGSHGFLKGKTMNAKGWVFWTVTLWENVADLQKFISTGAHLRSMPHLREWTSEAAVRHLTVEKDELPPGSLCFNYLKENPKFSKLFHPAAAHESQDLGNPSDIRYEGEF